MTLVLWWHFCFFRLKAVDEFVGNTWYNVNITTCTKARNYMKSTEYEKYLNLISQKKFEEAVSFKADKIPTVLHKYFGLNKDKTLNLQKIQCIAENKLYLSDFNSFNDPFEGKYFVFNGDKLSKKGWDKSQIEEFINGLTALWRVTCLSDTNEQNMPMWAYYANNHEGFCVEYILCDLQKKYILPVAYEKERQEANSIVTHIINAAMTVKMSGTPPSEEFSLYNHLMFLSMTAKHISWEHEREYRIMSPDRYFPAIPSKIYIGLNCTDENREKLIDIGKSSDGICKVYQMYLDSNNSKFELQKQKIV
ncbi:DUF2971 domain-containing protein [Lachnospiraceae bacterium ZAX-1]